MTIEASRDRAVSIGRGFMENGGGMRKMELLASGTSTAEGRLRPSNGRKTCSSSNKRRTDSLGVTRTMWFIGTFDLEAGPSLADCNKVKHSFFDFMLFFYNSQLLFKFVLLKTVRHDAGSGMLGLQRSP